MKIFMRAAAIVLIVVIVLLAFVLVSPGYNMYFVRSGSMIPTLNLGDMVVTGPVGGFLTGDVKPGTIITFQQSKSVVTHRAVSVNGENIVTKGDNNEDPDPNPVSMSKIVGIYLFKIPLVGYLVTFIRSKPGWFVLIIIPTAILLGFLIKDILKEAFTPNNANSSNRKRDEANVQETLEKASTNAQNSPIRSESDERLRNMLIETLNEPEKKLNETNTWR